MAYQDIVLSPNSWNSYIVGLAGATEALHMEALPAAVSATEIPLLLPIFVGRTGMTRIVDICFCHRCHCFAVSRRLCFCLGAHPLKVTTRQNGN